jgi:nucleoside-diphosphate-sugar epimerase
MKIFLTGVNGYLARSIAAYLLAEGHRIAGSSRSMVTMPGVEVVHRALGDRIDPSMFQDCDVIIHAAHDFKPGSMNKNIEGTLAMRDAAATAGVRQQIFLTSYSARPDADSEYGRTKYLIEGLFSDSASVTMRLGLVIGNGGLFARQRAALLRTPIVPLIGAGVSPVALVAISHVQAATEIIIRERLTGARNLFYDARPALKEFVQAVKRHAGQRPLVFPIGARFATATVKALKAIGLSIPIEPGQIRALQRNEYSPWRTDLPTLLPGRDPEFQLSYALDQLKSGH